MAMTAMTAMAAEADLESLAARYGATVKAAQRWRCVTPRVRAELDRVRDEAATAFARALWSIGGRWVRRDHYWEVDRRGMPCRFALPSVADPDGSPAAGGATDLDRALLAYARASAAHFKLKKKPKGASGKVELQAEVQQEHADAMRRFAELIQAEPGRSWRGWSVGGTGGLISPIGWTASAWLLQRDAERGTGAA